MATASGSNRAPVSMRRGTTRKRTPDYLLGAPTSLMTDPCSGQRVPRPCTVHRQAAVLLDNVHLQFVRVAGLGLDLQ